MSQVKLDGTVGPTTRLAGAWLQLLVLLSGTFVVILDFFIVNVAVPSLQSDLGATGAQVQLVVAGYGLTYGAGLVVGGRLGDVHGRRRVFVVGMALFVATSLACGVAPSIDVLIVSRVLQGAAAAVLAPQVLALLGVSFPDERRDWAFAGYGVALGVASGGGQLVGGALIDLDVLGLGWRNCFLVNVPIGVVALAAAPRLLPESRGSGSRRLDPAGAVLVTAAVAAAVVPLIEGRERGWPLWTVACFVAAGALAAGFAAHERARVARGRPVLVPPALFADRGFTLGMATVLAFYGGVASYFLVLSLYLQQGRGLEPFASGLVFSTMVVGFLLTTFAGGRLRAHLGRSSLAVGALVLAAGHVALRTAIVNSGLDGPLWVLVPGLSVAGAGIGLVMAPLVSTVLARTDPGHAGAASGVLAAGQQLGNAVGVAGLGIVFFAVTGPEPSAAGVVDAMAASQLYLIALALVVAGLLGAVAAGGSSR